jgi:hypothetical protein
MIVPTQIDVKKEALINLAEASKFFPPGRSGRPVSPSCLWRWVHKGVKLPDGATVKLEALRLGARWVTTMEAVQRFLMAQTPDLGEVPLPVRGSRATFARNKKDMERVDAELDAKGFRMPV